MHHYDTRILLGIKDEKDTHKRQNDLQKLYIWDDTNNMKFNASKLFSAIWKIT